MVTNLLEGLKQSESSKKGSLALCWSFGVMQERYILFCLRRVEMKEKNLDPLYSSMDILIAGLCIFIRFEFVSNRSKSVIFG